MTDTIRMLMVVLDRDTRTDDVEELVKAIKMLRGVADVTLGTPNDPDAFLARKVEHRNIAERIYRALASDMNGDWRYDLVEK